MVEACCIVSTKLTRLWSRFLVTEQNWSKVPCEHMRMQAIFCSNNHRVLRSPKKSNENGSTVVPVPWDGPLEPGHKVTARAETFARFCRRMRLVQNPSHRVLARRCVKHCLQRDNNRRDRNVRTPFREKTKEDGTERITGAELWEAVPLLPMSTSRAHGERMSESSIEGSSSSCSKKFFMPGDAVAQLHNLSSHMACPAVSETRCGKSRKARS